MGIKAKKGVKHMFAFALRGTGALLLGYADCLGYSLGMLVVLGGLGARYCGAGWLL